MRLAINRGVAASSIAFFILTGLGATAQAQVFSGIQINRDAQGNNIVGDAANEPSFAINPVNPLEIVASWREFATINSNFRKGGFAFSHDGGLTWTNGGILDDPPGTNNPNQTDPVMATDRDGNFFYNSMLFGSADGQTVYKSTDGGMTWDDADFIYRRGTDKNWYAVDQRATGLGAGNHYATWQFSGRIARSVDGGRNWETWSNGASLYAYLEIDPAGTVHTSWWENNGIDYRQSVNAKDPSKTPTFTPGVLIPVGRLPWQLPINPAGAAGMITIETPQTSEPNEGTIYVMTSAVRSDDVCDVMFSKSTDDGKTWSTPLQVNDDTDGEDFNWMAVMSLAPGGRIDAVWFDTRDDPAHFLSRLYYTCSYDGGDTWIPNRAISSPFDSTLGWPNQNKIGDYFQCLSDTGGTSIVYPATYNGEQDVYFLRHHPIDLRVDPLIGGQNATFTATDGRPNTRSFLAYSLQGTGRTEVAALNVVLGLSNPKMAGQAKFTDGAGMVAWNLPVPAGISGKDIWLQVAQRANSSNVVHQQIQ